MMSEEFYAKLREAYDMVEGGAKKVTFEDVSGTGVYKITAYRVSEVIRIDIKKGSVKPLTIKEMTELEQAVEVSNV